MRETITAALKAATLAQDKKRTGTLRLISAAIKDRDIAARTGGSGQATDAELIDLLAKMVKQRLESAKIYEDNGRPELAAQEREEIAVIEEYLPKQLNEDEAKAVIAAIVTETGATGIRDMNKVMSELKARYAGQMDFAKASAAVKAALSS
ncbi:MAG: GatB/YqeY domain-containing protein [Rhizobiales bacterium]|nr:GatB/YqeY domain-containing protein [Hyphomicrobiales bacterium]